MENFPKFAGRLVENYVFQFRFSSTNTGHMNASASTVNNDEETYAEKRARNNAAVKKSREKAKSKKSELRSEIELLQREIALLENEEGGLDCDIKKLKQKVLKR